MSIPIAEVLMFSKGARRLVEAIQKAKGKWAIVTSGTRVLAESWVKVGNVLRLRLIISDYFSDYGAPCPRDLRYSGSS